MREIERRELESSVLPDILPAVSALGASAPQSPASILRNIEERSQILVERGINEAGWPVMAFSHLTFQEFLVSLHFRDRKLIEGHSVVSAELLGLYLKNPSWWEEVILLYAAHLSAAEQTDFFDSIRPATDSGSALCPTQS
jgi:predicted NACHT family NTPase